MQITLIERYFALTGLSKFTITSIIVRKLCS